MAQAAKKDSRKPLAELIHEVEGKGPGRYWYISKVEGDSNAWKINARELGECRNTWEAAKTKPNNKYTLTSILENPWSPWYQKDVFQSDFEHAGYTTEEVYNYLVDQFKGTSAPAGKSDVQRLASIIAQLAPAKDALDLLKQLKEMIAKHEGEAVKLVSQWAEENGRDDHFWIRVKPKAAPKA